MRYAKYWGAVANHSGDAYFDFVYRSDWPRTLDLLAEYAPVRKPGRTDVERRARKTGSGIDDGRIAKFLKAVWENEAPSDTDIHCLMNLCMAATYDPDRNAPNGFRIPFDLETGELLPARWRKWLRNDPVHMVPRYATALRTLKGIYVDCGWRDQYFIPLWQPPAVPRVDYSRR